MKKINLFSGNAPINGWINVDMASNADVVHDLRGGIPFDTNSVDYVYNEHGIEHMTHEEGKRLLAETYRVLALGGKVRIATPCLNYIVDRYNSASWKNQEWLKWDEYQYIKTPCEMLNVAMREWGHCYVYDYEQLHTDLLSAGFTEIFRLNWGESENVELRDLETRKDSLLIVEATKQ